MRHIDPRSYQSLRLSLRFQGIELAVGTGFIVAATAGPVLITNWHNVSGRNPTTGRVISSHCAVPDEIAIQHVVLEKAHGFVQTIAWEERVEPLYDDDGSRRWFEHPVHGQRVDVVALPLTDCAGVSLETYPLARLGEVPLEPADVVHVIGYPFGRDAGGRGLAVWATGTVASEPTIDVDKLPQMLVDCRTRPGQSGSPVIALEQTAYVKRTLVEKTPRTARLLGVYSGRIRPDSDLGMVWKTSAVREIVATVTKSR